MSVLGAMSCLRVLCGVKLERWGREGGWTKKGEPCCDKIIKTPKNKQHTKTPTTKKPETDTSAQEPARASRPQSCSNLCKQLCKHLEPGGTEPVLREYCRCLLQGIVLGSKRNYPRTPPQILEERGSSLI